MLDGRVLEASQVEYKPFGKPPLQKKYRECRDSLEKPCIELPRKFDSESFNTSANTSAICVHIPAAP